METKRQNKIARLIQKEISEILQSITKEMNQGVLIIQLLIINLL